MNPIFKPKCDKRLELMTKKTSSIKAQYKTTVVLYFCDYYISFLGLSFLGVVVRVLTMGHITKSHLGFPEV